MAFPIVLVMLLQLPASLESRVIEPRDAPVSLVGLPCGDAGAKVLATLPTTPGDTTAPLRSEAFQCGPNCRVGIRVNKGAAAVDSIVVASSVAYDRGRVVTTVSPSLPTSVWRKCNGESIYTASLPKLDWKFRAVFYFVAEVRFQDGTTWATDRESFPDVALADWFLRPKRGQ